MFCRYHPDRNRGNEEEATEKFKEAKEAFDVLNDPKKRKIYDRHGEAGLSENGPGGMDDVFSRFSAAEDAAATTTRTTRAPDAAKTFV